MASPATMRYLSADAFVLASAIIYDILGWSPLFSILLLAWLYKVFTAAGNFKTSAGLAFVNFGIFFWYVYPSAISMTDVEARFDQSFSFLHITLAVLAILTTITDFAWSKVIPSTLFFVSTTFKQFRLAATIFSIIGTGWVISHTLSLNEFTNAMLTGRGAGDDKMWQRGDTNFSSSLNDSFALLFNAFLVAATIMFSFLVSDRGRPARKMVLSVIYLALITFSVIDSGTRFVLAIATLPAFISWLIIARLSAFRMVAIAVFSLALVIGSQFLMHGRHYGYQYVGDDEIGRDLATLGGTIDYFSETQLAMERFRPGEYPESNLFIFATNLIPRSIFPSKPYSRVAEHYTYEVWGLNILVAGGNKFPGIVGQYYISSGWLLFVAIPLFWGFFSSAVSSAVRIGLNKRETLALALPIAYGVWLFFSFRFVSPGQFLPIFFFHVALLLIGRISEKGEIEGQLR